MTFRKWIESDYNTTTICIEDGRIVPYAGYTGIGWFNGGIDSVIGDGFEYSFMK